jgi:glycosyltransferase involved in cell wall biosynthesis
VNVSAVVLTKNEEGNIGPCLSTLLWADEIIVVDSQSTDNTVAHARAFTGQVYVEPWRGFGPQKNFGIDHASGKWILIIDADERVTEELQREILAAIASVKGRSVVGFRIPRRNYFYGSWMKNGGMFPDYQIRLFLKDVGRYDDTLLHENLIIPGNLETLHSPLDHHSIPSIAHHVRKMQHYTSLAAMEKLKKIQNVSSLTLMSHHLVIFFKTFILKSGWKDGTPGLVAALFAAMHTFVKYAKAYEMLEIDPCRSHPSHVSK